MTEMRAMAAAPAAPLERACPLCGDPNADGAVSRHSREPWPMKTCGGCGMTYLTRAPGYAPLFADMAWERTVEIEDRRRRAEQPVSYRLSRATRWRMRLLPRKTMPDLLALHAAPGNTVDLGCGDGNQMRHLSPAFTPFGIEISAELAARSDARFRARGGEVINAPCVEGLRRFPDRFFAAATLRSYLEHELHPVAVLAEVRRTLIDGGVALVKVPNHASLNRVVRGGQWCGYRFPDHLNYFTPATLTRMARENGFIAWFGATWRLPTSDNMWCRLTKA